MLLTKMERESSTSRLSLDDVCGKQPKNFKKDRHFQNHYRTHAEEEFKCQECPSVWSGGPETTFNTKKQMISHIHQYHQDNKKCSQCSKSFSCLSNRISHEATHSTIFECQSCEKIYTNNTSYKKHVNSCSGTKTPVESFPCKDCDKTFPRNSHLTRHMKTHTGAKPKTTPCNQCDMNISLGNMARHVNEKHKVSGSSQDFVLIKDKKKAQIITCRLCSITFTAKKSRLRHNRKIHPQTGEDILNINQLSLIHI